MRRLSLVTIYVCMPVCVNVCVARGVHYSTVQLVISSPRLSTVALMPEQHATPEN